MISIKPAMNVDGRKHMQFYLIENSVGLYGKNSSKAEIQLVQIFLKYTFNDPIYRYWFNRLPQTRQKLGAVKVDGIVGPQTIGAIRMFQEIAGLKVPQPGRCDPVRNPVSKDDNQYFETMLRLNQDFYWSTKIKAEEDFRLINLPEVKNSAPELYVELLGLELRPSDIFAPTAMAGIR